MSKVLESQLFNMMSDRTTVIDLRFGLKRSRDASLECYSVLCLNRARIIVARVSDATVSATE